LSKVIGRELASRFVTASPPPLYLLILHSKAKWFPTPAMGKGIQKKYNINFYKKSKICKKKRVNEQNEHESLLMLKKSQLFDFLLVPLLGKFVKII